MACSGPPHVSTETPPLYFAPVRSNSKPVLNSSRGVAKEGFTLIQNARFLQIWPSGGSRTAFTAFWWFTHTREPPCRRGWGYTSLSTPGFGGQVSSLAAHCGQASSLAASGSQVSSLAVVLAAGSLGSGFIPVGWPWPSGLGCLRAIALPFGPGLQQLPPAVVPGVGFGSDLYGVSGKLRPNPITCGPGGSWGRPRRV